MPRVLQRRATLEDRANLEAIVRQHGWSMKTLSLAASELGLHPRTVRRLWNSSVRFVAEGGSVGDVVRERRNAQLARLEYLIARATEDKQYGAAAKAESVYAQVAGTFAPTRVEHAGTVSVFHSAAAAAVSRMSPEELHAAAYAGLPDGSASVPEAAPAVPAVIEATFEEVSTPDPATTPAPGPSPAVARALDRLTRGRPGRPVPGGS